MKTVNDFINNSGLNFTDISTEESRQYIFGNGVVVIEGPLLLNVSASGGHRIFDQAGVSHYIPAGWIHLSWDARNGQANFVK